MGIDTNIKAGITLGTKPRNQFDIQLESKWMTNKRQQPTSNSGIEIGDPMGKPTGDQQGKNWGSKKAVTFLLVHLSSMQSYNWEYKSLILNVTPI